MEYAPDSWKIVKLTNKENGDVHHRIIAGWTGGYLQGSSWKISSGIEKITDEVDFWNVPNTSGSVYFLYKGREYLSGYVASIYDNLAKTAEDVTMDLVQIDEIINQYK